MFKFPYLALTRPNSPNLATVKWIPVLISQPTLSVTSQLLHKGKTPKNTDFKSLKDSVFFLKENRVFAIKKYVIDPSHPSGISNSLGSKGISPLKIRCAFSYLTLSCLGVTTGLSNELPGTT